MGTAEGRAMGAVSSGPLTVSTNTSANYHSYRYYHRRVRPQGVIINLLPP